ncbi:type IV pilus modification PilV family protein [Laspinema olomoucense]|uniref:type IV pilus modification PilV family protein n=1 Tax=Laspinema olomoucense TaxID=3231600 RepID=UPI0021BB141C|nr:type II secretion system protein [Laspinema sp. D3c]MCT7993929.1 type II secretion system GspH family protein [Laspinema sp. D3c]
MQRRSQFKSTESGLTLIECLAAIVIFSMAIVAVTPPIMLSMAARVRAHNAEKAMQLAQGEVDRVRVLLEALAAETDATKLAQLKAQLPPLAEGKRPQGIAAPEGATTSCTSNSPPAAVTTACLEAGSIFGIQTFITNRQTDDDTETGMPVAFWVGVRVYTAGAFSGGRPLTINPGSLAFSAANNMGSAPLAVQYAPLIVSDLPDSAEKYKALLAQ